MLREARRRVGWGALVVALLLVVVAFVRLAAGAAPLTGAAAAHASDCHAANTCPADDHSYVWVDGAGQGWSCALRGSPQATDADTTAMTVEGVEYVCRAAGEEPAPVADPSAEPDDLTAPGSALPAGQPVDSGVDFQPTGEPGPTPPPAAPAARHAPRPRAAPAPVTASVAPVFRPPPRVTPKLTAGGYVFPVFGPSAYVDTFGAARATVSWHHGVDIFAPKGAPILAVANGTVFSVGWNDIGGNRLWLRDREGNEFYYAHLSAFSTLAVNGAQVRAGTVLGFVGTTGDAEGTPPHLHFEIHPVGLLSFGYDGAVNPTPYLQAWQRLEDIAIGPGGVVFGVGGRINAPKPAAIFLGAADISRADALDARALRRALGTPPREAEMQALLEPFTSASLGLDEEERASLQRKLEAAALRHASESLDELEEHSVWDLLAWCESSGDWSADTGNGYYGGLQFAPGTWRGYGGGVFAPSAAQATREEQIAIARRVLVGQGWVAWPVCSARLGLRASTHGR